MKHLARMMLIFATLFALQTAFASDDMQILRDKVKADKKLVVALNMELTEAEGKAFWPVYEDYQKDLEKLNQRTATLIRNYADEYTANTLTDEKAGKLVDEMIAIEKAEADLKKSYVPKLGKALSMKKVARYLQIENKIRVLVKVELADAIPLAE